MDIKILLLPPIGTNCCIISSCGKCAVIDPASCADMISYEIKKSALVPEYILLTHGHFDHIGGADELKARFPEAKLMISGEDAAMLADPVINASALFLGNGIFCRSAYETVSDGDIITLGNENISVMATPGHTKGSLCYECADCVFTGDTVFADGYGRTDLPNAAPEKLLSSVNKVKKKCRGKTAYPGHGDKFII